MPKYIEYIFRNVNLNESNVRSLDAFLEGKDIEYIIYDAATGDLLIKIDEEHNLELESLVLAETGQTI